MSRTTTKTLTVILEGNFGDDINDDWILESVNGLNSEQIGVPPENARMTDEQAFEETWDGIGTDLFWMPGEAPTKRFVKITGYLWWEEINSIDYGVDYDSGFEIEDMEESMKPF